MKRLLLIIFTFFTLCCPIFAKSVEFAVIADSHLVPSNNQDSFSVSEKNLIYAVESINKNQNIQFVVFLGDCIDKSNMDSLKAFMNIVQNINKPYYIVLGNHDSYSAGGIEKEEFIKFIHEYNKNQDKKETSFYFKGAPNVYGLILDGSSWVVPGRHGRYLPEQLKEVEKLFKFKKNDIILVFQHFPILHPNDNISHYTFDTEPYWRLLDKYTNVAMIASGHFHFKKLTYDRNGIYHISAPAFGARANSSGSGTYEIIKLNYDKGLFSKPHNISIEVKDVPI